MSWEFFSGPGIASSPSTASPATFSFWAWFKLNQNGAAATAQTIMRENGARISLQVSLASGFDDLVFTRSGMTGSIVCDMSANGITADDAWVFVGLAMSGFTTLDRFVLATEATPAFAATVTNTLAGTGFTAAGIKSLGNSSASAQPIEGWIHSAGFHTASLSLAQFETARTTFDQPASADWTYVLADPSAPWEQTPSSGAGNLTGTGVTYSADAPSFGPAPVAPDTTIPARTVMPAGRAVEETIIMRGEGGAWLQVGRDAARGITHEGLSVAVDRAGPSTASFTLRRDPAVSWPDLSPFNEILVEVAGALVWSGRMREAPGQSGQSDTISVTASGWQTHLDDDLLALGWVHARMAEWRPASTYPGLANLSSYPNGLITRTDGGEPVVGWAQGSVMTGSTRAAIALDLGALGSPITRVVVEWSMPVINNYTDAYVVAYPFAAFSGAPVNVLAKASSSFVAGVRAINAATVAASRSFIIELRRGAAADLTLPAEHALRLHRILLFADAADESGNDSALLASTVVGEVAASGRVPLLSTDASGIETTGFAIPHYWPTGHQSPRELMSPVNAFHDYDLGVDARRRVFFRPLPSTATLELGPWSGAEFSDASAGSGEDVYNKVIVQAQGADGTPLEVIRSAATAAPELARLVTVPALANTGFEVDTAGWTLSNFTRSNAVTAHQGAWSLRGVANAVSVAAATMTGLIPGQLHTLSFWVRVVDSGSGGADSETQLFAGAAGRIYISRRYYPKDNLLGWLNLRFNWSPQAASEALGVSVAQQRGLVHLDSFSVTRAESNAVDRHGFVRAARLPIGAPLTAAAAEVLGDVWLRNHIRTPLKGSVTVTAQGGVREALGGAPVHPAHLLLRHGEVLRHTGMADPDTGAWGRNGRIASVSYSAGRAVIELDNERHRLEALIARYAAIAGGVA